MVYIPPKKKKVHSIDPESRVAEMGLLDAEISTLRADNRSLRAMNKVLEQENKSLHKELEELRAELKEQNNEDFFFNQDIEYDEGLRSPGWARLQKRKLKRIK